ncbi:hypothetical protein MTO96_005527 [Rhipicephalus appendiculatus]
MKVGCSSLLVLAPLFLCAAVQSLPTGYKAGGKATKLFEAESSRVVSVDGQVQASSNKEKEVKDARSGETLASVKESSQLEQRGPGEQPHSVSRTQVDVPALGIHETKVEDSSNANNNMQRQLLPGPGPTEKKNYVPYFWNAEEPDRSDYTPTDLAEYILRTGDEEGVAMAVEELLRQGMMTREEAIVYLHDVKAEMNYIRAQQEKLRKIQELRKAISMMKKDEFKTHPLLITKVKDKSQQPRKPCQKPGKTSAQGGGYGQEAKSPRTSKLSKLKDTDEGSFEGSNSPA